MPRPIATPTLSLLLLALLACTGQAGTEQGDDCDNQRDDDGDHLVDCADPGCAFELACDSCGDGIRDDNEGCDDGNLDDDDDCSDRCLLPLCPNGFLDAGEQCDDGNFIGADGCSLRCRFDHCGDRVLDGGEQCEDGNRASGDGCSSTCTSELPESCGDGTIASSPETFEQLEQCDDGNRASGDGCSSTCTFEFCGDGVTQQGIGEQCDDDDPFRSPTCEFCRLPRCGDFFVSTSEQCDDGNRSDGDGCSADCRAEFCGDGVVQVQRDEACDDGNDFNDDDCSFCQQQ